MSASATLEHALTRGTLEDILRAALEVFGCQAGTVHLFDGTVLTLAASINIPPHIVEVIRIVPVGKGIAGLAAERREPISLCNLQTDDSGQARPAAKSTGMEGALAVPMLAGELLAGVFGVAKSAAYDWSEEEKSQLLEIGVRTASRTFKVQL